MTTQPQMLAIHGGAGVIRPDAMTPESEVAYHAGLRAALLAGHALLTKGGTALDAVTAAVMALENDPQFNAGRELCSRRVRGTRWMRQSWMAAIVPRAR